MTNSRKIVRVIQWFDKKSGSFVGEEIIKQFDLQEFKRIFNHVDHDDPNIYGGNYDVLTEHVGRIQPFLDHKIDLAKYDYEFSTYHID